MTSKSKLGFCVGLPYADAYRIFDSGCRYAGLRDQDEELMWHLHHVAGGEHRIISTIAQPFGHGASFPHLFAELGTSDPEELAERWWAAAAPIIRQSTPPGVIWRAVNEPPTDPESLTLLNRFEKHRLHIAAQEGWQAGVGGFSVGMPDIDAWNRLYGMLEACHQHHGVLCLNEYIGGVPAVYYGPYQEDAIGRGEVDPLPQGYAAGWLFGRYRKVWREHIQPHHWGGIQIALTEIGCDRVALTANVINYLGQNPEPWRDMEDGWKKTGVWRGDKQHTYLAILKWLDGQMCADPFLLCGNIFDLSDPLAEWWEDSWGRFNVAPMLDLILAYIGAQ